MPLPRRPASPPPGDDGTLHEHATDRETHLSDLAVTTVNNDIDEQHLRTVLGERSIRSYPAVLSTEASAMAWARENAPTGSVVIADYQASPRGRGGLVWTVEPGHSLAFTLILRPELNLEREGWPYVPALLALHDVVGTDRTGLLWPDTIEDDTGTVHAGLGVYVEPGPHSTTQWMTVNVLIPQATQPRAELLAQLLAALERRISAPAGQVLSDYIPLCRTMGQQRRARLIPMGPGGPEVNGKAVDVLADGALVLLTARGNRVAVPPHNLGMLEDPEGVVEPPAGMLRSPTNPVTQVWPN